MQYLVDNKEWIFSGIGVTAILAVWGLIRFGFRRKGGENSQTQRSGAFSTNTQIGSISLGRDGDKQ